jgi:hypothetical protein
MVKHPSVCGGNQFLGLCFGTVAEAGPVGIRSFPKDSALCGKRAYAVVDLASPAGGCALPAVISTGVMPVQQPKLNLRRHFMTFLTR